MTKEDRKEIYFTSINSSLPTKDRFKGLNIYYTHREETIDKWSIPSHLTEINSDFDDKMPTISPDGKYLVFIESPGGFGEFDLWISERVHTATDPNPKWSVLLILEVKLIQHLMKSCLFSF